MEVDDPLFGLIPDKLLGKDPLTGKPKIAEEVLEDMRLYIIAASGQEKLAREERVKKSLKDLEEDPPIISKDLDKGKGVVFDFKVKEDKRPAGEKLMAGAISAGNKVLQSGKILSQPLLLTEGVEPVQATFLQEGSMGYNIGCYEPSVSGAALKRTYKRRRPGTRCSPSSREVHQGQTVCQGYFSEVLGNCWQTCH
ncbi:hypothetical protein Bca52824_086536 [Brassica carinata]|uniref:Uncharacterized protein n=1 Tax=Brassica carinata TaxID=52824 RepID=A0A8X7PAE8_BRACI|nr:hypothetical protein Bca52824_086536 [Brassica carinata]